LLIVLSGRLSQIIYIVFDIQLNNVLGFGFSLLAV